MQWASSESYMVSVQISSSNKRGIITTPRIVQIIAALKIFSSDHSIKTNQLADFYLLQQLICFLK